MPEPDTGSGAPAGELQRHLAAAQAALGAGRPTDAMAHAERAIAVDRRSPSGHFLQGVCLLAQNRFAEAAACFRRAVELNPDFANYQFHLGIALGRAGSPSEAQVALRRAIELDPQFVPPYQALGQMLSSQGDRKSAIDLLEAAQRLKPDPGGSVLLAQNLYLEARVEEAEAEVRRAMELDPRSVTAHDLLSSILQEVGRFDESIAVARRGLELKPASGALGYRIVKSKRMTDEDGPFIERMERALQNPNLDPQDRRFLHYAIGKAFDDLGNFKAAMEHWDEANRVSARLQFGGRSFPRAQYQASFERVKQQFTRQFLQTRAGGGSDSQLPLLVVGLMRSGTTLVEQILSCHPDIGAAGELPFWLDEVESKWLGRQADTGSQDTASLVERYLGVLSEAAPGATRVTDKMPNNYMVLGLVHALFPRARIIHCRRDPADNAISIYATPFGEPPKFAYDKDNIVFGIEQYSMLMAHWTGVLPEGTMLEIRYEDLVHEPERVTRQMIEFCGLPWKDTCLEHTRNDRLVRTPSVWQVRQPIYERSVGRWRNYEPWLGPFRRLVGRRSR